MRCARCGESYDADTKGLCDACMSRPRSTCSNWLPKHPPHDWDKGNAQLWCPGTDGSNPQVPKELANALRKRYTEDTN